MYVYVSSKFEFECYSENVEQQRDSSITNLSSAGVTVRCHLQPMRADQSRSDQLEETVEHVYRQTRAVSFNNNNNNKNELNREQQQQRERENFN